MTTCDLDLLTAELDQNPQDHNLLFALGELWEETEPGIGVGVQALIKCGRVPWYWSGSCNWGWWLTRWWDHRTGYDRPDDDTVLGQLPRWWLCKIKGQKCYDRLPGRQRFRTENVIVCEGFLTSGAHRAYLAAARAVLKLPAERQEQLLRGEL